MSIPPQPYPPPYGAPRPATVGPSAGWAGILLIIFGVVALLMGGCAMSMGAMLPTLMDAPEIRQDPNVQRMFDELSKSEGSFERRFYVFGGMLLGYALAAIVLGILLVRARGTRPVVASLVLVTIVLALLGLQVIGALMLGSIPGLLMVLVLVGMHALVLFWLLQALRSSPGMPTMYSGYPGYNYPPPPPPQQPMQGYYQSPRE